MNHAKEDLQANLRKHREKYPFGQQIPPSKRYLSYEGFKRIQRNEFNRRKGFNPNRVGG